MKELKWVKFSEKQPDASIPWFWVSDYNFVKLKRYEYFPRDSHDHVWVVWAISEIEYPPLPEPEKKEHLCYSGVLKYFVCKSYDDSLCIMRSDDPRDIFIHADYCPFCGYTPKEYLPEIEKCYE